MKVRQDAWSHEDDLILAETVLRHVREGSTQLKAFEEVGSHLHRTAAACGFRWNSEVRQKYDQAMEIAKKQRKEKQRSEGKQFAIVEMQEEPQENIQEITSTESTTGTLTIDTAISYLTRLKVDGNHLNRQEKELLQLQTENEALQQKRTSLQKKLDTLTVKHKAIQEDYQSLIGIMDRARQLVFHTPAPAQSNEQQA
ncbi:RsfA family transcriptional regulator [Bacillus tianshenii]|nr:RsfA family transcriptional regulator [Bacillus tianshenii]